MCAVFVFPDSSYGAVTRVFRNVLRFVPPASRIITYRIIKFTLWCTVQCIVCIRYYRYLRICYMLNYVLRYVFCVLCVVVFPGVGIIAERVAQHNPPRRTM